MLISWFSSCFVLPTPLCRALPADPQCHCVTRDNVQRGRDESEGHRGKNSGHAIRTSQYPVEHPKVPYSPPPLISGANTLTPSLLKRLRKALSDGVFSHFARDLRRRRINTTALFHTAVLLTVTMNEMYRPTCE
ncbi:hypothetical protein DPEC_G00027910 [Dallia pectoralis]|uniref:Uncharacterized protein n=1 Tax=Dallia pectoralis TaxID=75939 RepID=A0ACC2HHY1_DALPE|nr:hypothetical protein DPEC_G00027910 [Dallia pectoralis]